MKDGLTVLATIAPPFGFGFYEPMGASQNSRRTAWISCILATLVLYVVTWPIVEIKFAQPHFTGSMSISRTAKCGADTYTTTQSAKGLFILHSGPTPMPMPMFKPAPTSSRLVMIESFYYPLHRLRYSKGGEIIIDPYYNWWLKMLL